ncbi:MAG: hypothetical protein VX733_04010 [Candidatus Latescibacterota bacterium]|nr:hypothetical protein [Candidatus Latescibacterota bacterium]
MADVLHISAAVVTHATLAAEHAGESEVRLATVAVVTPSGWDYIRSHRLRLSRSATATAVAPGAAPAAARPDVATGALVEVLPPGSSEGLLCRGRYDQPHQAYGCRTEEFGSGFAQPESCQHCALNGARSSNPGSCDGCNLNRSCAGVEVNEALVRRLTDEIMQQLGGN